MGTLHSGVSCHTTNSGMAVGDKSFSSKELRMINKNAINKMVFLLVLAFSLGNP